MITTPDARTIILTLDDNFFDCWWMEARHLPAVGSSVIPFESGPEAKWMENTWSVEVLKHRWYVSHDTVVVEMEMSDRPEKERMEGFNDEMKRAGWSFGEYDPELREQS